MNQLLLFCLLRLGLPVERLKHVVFLAKKSGLLLHNLLTYIADLGLEGKFRFLFSQSGQPSLVDLTFGVLAIFYQLILCVEIAVPVFRQSQGYLIQLWLERVVLLLFELVFLIVFSLLPLKFFSRNLRKNTLLVSVFEGLFDRAKTRGARSSFWLWTSSSQISADFAAVFGVKSAPGIFGFSNRCRASRSGFRGVCFG